jgi:hypothetical protein
MQLARQGRIAQGYEGLHVGAAQAVDVELWALQCVRIPTNVTGCTDERDRSVSADAWCSNSTLIGHDDQTQGCP